MRKKKSIVILNDDKAVLEDISLYNIIIIFNTQITTQLKNITGCLK